jgi:hypothetical protein
VGGGRYMIIQFRNDFVSFDKLLPGKKFGGPMYTCAAILVHGTLCGDPDWRIWMCRYREVDI